MRNILLEEDAASDEPSPRVRQPPSSIPHQERGWWHRASECVCAPRGRSGGAPPPPPPPLPLRPLRPRGVLSLVLFRPVGVWSNNTMARRKAERGADHLVDEWRLLSPFFPFRHRVACFRCADVARGTWHAMAKDEVSHAKTQRRHQGEAWAVHSMVFPPVSRPPSARSSHATTARRRPTTARLADRPTRSNPDAPLPSFRFRHPAIAPRFHVRGPRRRARAATADEV